MELTPEEIRARRLRKLETSGSAGGGGGGGSRLVATTTTTTGSSDGQQQDSVMTDGEAAVPAQAESTPTVNSVDAKPLGSPTKSGSSETPSNNSINTAPSTDGPTKMDEDPPASNEAAMPSSPVDTPTKTAEDKSRDEAATREELQQIVFRIMNINSQIRYSEARFTIDPAVLANALEALDAKNYREFCAEIFIEVVKEFYEGKLIQSGVAD